MMMDLLERVGERERTWLCVLPSLLLLHTLTHFLAPSVDLFVRESNDLAIGLYESLGYIIFRKVRGYYEGGPREPDEDAFGESLSLWDCEELGA